jgi:hypothetical protein
MEFTVPDCLVLKIQEYDSETRLLDTSIFVLYDKKNHQFVLRGHRRNTKRQDACTYSFVCNYAKDLADFISFVICRENLWTYVLYNYDNLPADSNDITYEFLLYNESKTYELSAYDKVKYSRHKLLKNLRMLRNVFNYYN